jgi:hypothetical protein
VSAARARAARRARLVRCVAVAPLLVAACRPAEAVTPVPVPTGAPVDSALLRRGPSMDLSRAQRFEIAAVGDSTLVLAAPSATWVRPGKRGIAVDPRRRDVLVARFEVLRRSADSVTALVTGQTQRITTDHVALLERPADTVIVRESVVVRRRGTFWIGALTGAVVGAAAGLLVGR